MNDIKSATAYLIIQMRSDKLPKILIKFIVLNAAKQSTTTSKRTFVGEVPGSLASLWYEVN